MPPAPQPFESPKRSPESVGPFSLAALEHAVRAVEPAALLVPPRILRRVIKEDRELPGFGYDVPHPKSYVIGREPLLRIADHADLGLAADAVLPEQVVLLARPDAEALAALTAGEALVDCWRQLFHARVHVALQAQIDAGRLTVAEVRRRIQQLGATEFDELRSVLQQEELLLPPSDERAVYVEFAATYLELLYFDWPRLRYFFPGLAQGGRATEVLQQDVEAPQLFLATRPTGAPDPVPEASTPILEPDDLEAWPVELEGQAQSWVRPAASPSEDKYRRQIRRAERAAARRNVVRALMSRARAEAVVPPWLVEPSLAELHADLDRFVSRLQAALGEPVRDRQRWGEVLLALVRRTTPGIWTAEAKLLYDLQKVCDDFERDVYTVDLVEWALSLGKRPIQRLLPNQRVVMMCKHLRAVARRLTTVRLSDYHRHQLSELIHAASEQAEERLRIRLRPLIIQVLDEVQLLPLNIPERIARGKLVEELLDRIAEHGLLTMGDLRDAVSRNNLKLADSAFRADFLNGDQLLRADARLAVALDGVYNRGEIYRRWMQQLSSWGFGTNTGRFITRFIAVPYGGAYLALAGLEHLVSLFPGSEAAAPSWPVLLLQVFLLGLFLTGLIHLEPFRQSVWQGLKGAFRAAREAVVQSVRWLKESPLVQLIFRSRLFKLGMRFLLKPLLLTWLIWLLFPWKQGSPQASWGRGAMIFVGVCALLNSRLGRNLEELTAEWLVESWQRFGLRFFANLFLLIVDVFKRAVQATERVLYSVDEWLRFRSGESRLVLVGKALLGVVWFAFTYVTRFCVNLLIEPQINPIKHFPVVTVAHKLLLPFIPHLGYMLSLTIEKAPAYAIATTVITAIPGIFGFLVWELKENWRLYGANRPSRLKPVPIGHHGETLSRLLKPGFRSGTLPKQYTKLRHAEHQARQTGNWRAVRKHLQALQQIEQALRRFIEREFLTLFAESPAWQTRPVTLERITLSSNRVRMELACPDVAPASLQLDFAVQSGWLQAMLAEPGWSEQLPPPQRLVLRTALLGLYQLGGVDLIAEQIETLFSGALVGYQCNSAGLAVWPTASWEVEALYDLRSEAALLTPRITGAPLYFMPAIERARLLLSDTPLGWQPWVAAWPQVPAGPVAPPDFLSEVQLLPEP